MFCVCLVLIKNAAEQEETISVLVTRNKIAENQKIDVNDSAVAVKEIPISLVPEDVVKNVSDIAGKFAVCTLGRNQIVTASMFTDKQIVIEDIKNPVEISIGASNIDQIVGGVLREGDIVNISVVEEKVVDGERVYETNQVVSKAYILRTFTSSGTKVDSADKKEPVMIINILIDDSEEKEFNAALRKGTLRISRIYN